MAAKQKNDREISAPVADKAEAGADLVTLVKNGETLEVHPSCVADHKRQGWSEA